MPREIVYPSSKPHSDKCPCKVCFTRWITEHVAVVRTDHHKVLITRNLGRTPDTN